MRGKIPSEAARLAVLAAAAFWLLHPFATSRMYGAGDALWYANMLADFVIQLRHGIFPIFVGQTEFAFNGAVYPLRVAPLYQHLAGIIDLLTGRSLGFIALQHATVIVCGVAGLLASYGTLCRIAPERRWSAVGFAILYLSCPGLLGTIYTQDLYMTWMTVPLAPLAVYGIVRTFRKDDVASQVWLSAPLAALWWAHAPIALWFTLIAAASQAYRIARADAPVASLKRAFIGAAVFGVLAQYPFVSVACIKTPGASSPVVGSLDHPEKLMGFVREVFPANLKPLTSHAQALSDLQLGYALWAVLLLSLASLTVRRSRDVAILGTASVALLILLFPIPGITAFLWDHVPATVVRITYYWPMQRFYLILAALLAGAGQLVLSKAPEKGSRLRKVLPVVLALGCLWSLFESRQFLLAAQDRARDRATTEKLQLSENILLMDHAYGLFANVPAYFTNGVVAPWSQFRLLKPDSQEPLPANRGTPLAQGRLTGTVDANPGILDLSPTFRLEPGHRYELDLDFALPSTPGILQVTGALMSREYPLPDAGASKAFGSGEHRPHELDLWTSGTEPEDVQLRFIPLTPGSHTADYISFGHFRLWDVTSLHRAVNVTGLLPLTLTADSAAPGLLETPRVSMPGYRAMIDGNPAKAVTSPEGLVAVPLPAGQHRVDLAYVGPLSLRLSYWIAVLAWTFVLGAATVQFLRVRS
jgi:hypothetical protein